MLTLLLSIFHSMSTKFLLTRWSRYLLKIIFQDSIREIHESATLAEHVFTLHCTAIYQLAFRKRRGMCSKSTIKTVMSFQCYSCKLWTYFKPFPSFSIIYFEQLNVCWVATWLTRCSNWSFDWVETSQPSGWYQTFKFWPNISVALKKNYHPQFLHGNKITMVD